ncbi:recombinase family protein [Natronosporangium hydrolyticum]|uniref:Recombinase family protein n=1 Tax=Natronosporangium hydrolyticum TaxID=2811111 RepID=A0A895YHI1_9ACTN|nr:recombinase family protein [Natronosporangium hydrolyticum]QSB17001.1 recombinase family protein [Natronosporangium hydrolyticum]
MATTHPHVAIYTRISKDRYGNAETCLDQENLGRAYAAKVWPGLPVKVYSDPDLSAFRDDVYRPGYEALREAIKAGQVVHLWAVEQTRLERREVPWFELAALLDVAGVELLHTHRDGIVRVQDEVAGIKAVLSAAEVRKMKKRQADKFDAQAARGVPPGSRPTGYAHGRTGSGERTYVIVPEQAEAIREAAELVLAGWALENIAGRLRERGLQGAHMVKVRDANGQVVTDEAGNPLRRAAKVNGSTVKNMLTNPTIAGLRVHRGEVVGRGNWEPIVDEATWRQVCAKLRGNRKVTTATGATYVVGDKHQGNQTGRRYLLTGGIAVCGVCGAALVGSEKQFRNKTRGVYTRPYLFCHPRNGGKGCVGILGTETEEYVVAELLEEIKRRRDHELIDDGAAGAQRDRLTTELAGIDEQRKELARMWATRQLTGTEWGEARAAFDAEQHRIEVELAGLPVPAETRDPAAILADWPVMTLDERRQVIRDYIEAVTVHRAKPGTKGFDRGRVAIEWR